MSTWVLLRGLTRGSGHWAGFPALLSERLGSAQVVTLDLPGNGTLHDVRSPARIEAMTDSAMAQLRTLGLAPPYHLLAVSMGAMVAVDWATRAPSSLAACVLINTSLRPVSPPWQRLRPSALAALLRNALWPTSAAQREAAVLRLTSRDPAAAAAVLAPWAALRTVQPVSRANALRQLIAAARFRAPTPAPDAPVLVLGSARDALVDPRCSMALAERWRSAVEIHPTAGHDLTLDDGPWVIDQIAAWLRAGA